LEKKLFNLWIFPEWDPGALPLEKKNISKNDNKMFFFEITLFRDYGNCIAF